MITTRAALVFGSSVWCHRYPLPSIEEVKCIEGEQYPLKTAGSMATHTVGKGKAGPVLCESCQHSPCAENSAHRKLELPPHSVAKSIHPAFKLCPRHCKRDAEHDTICLQCGDRLLVTLGLRQQGRIIRRAYARISILKVEHNVLGGNQDPEFICAEPLSGGLGWA